MLTPRPLSLSASPVLLPTLSCSVGSGRVRVVVRQAGDKEHEEEEAKMVQEKDGTSRSMDLVEGGGHSSSLWTNHGVRAPPLSPPFLPHLPPRFLIDACAPLPQPLKEKQTPSMHEFLEEEGD